MITRITLQRQLELIRKKLLKKYVEKKDFGDKEVYYISTEMDKKLNEYMSKYR